MRGVSEEVRHSAELALLIDGTSTRRSTMPVERGEAHTHGYVAPANPTAKQPLSTSASK